MQAYPKSHLKVAVLMAIALLVAFTALPEHEGEAVTTIPVSLSVSEPMVVAATTVAEAPIHIAAPEPLLEPQTLWQTLAVRPGDNMSKLFQRAGLSPRELHEIMSLGKEVSVLKKIMPGKSLALERDLDGNFRSLRYQESALRNLVVRRNGNLLEAAWEVVEPEVIISWATATISDEAPSLYHAGKKAGLSDNIIMQLSHIFQWDISFALDLRQGDSFSLMFEDIYVEGEKVKEGAILAAQFVNMGETHNAVLYTDAKGSRNYYTPEGRSLRKAFLRDPVHFSYVSSSFNLRRLHPIHNKVMPHRGIDYAAKKGTPVLASGDGKVTIARQNNASGKYIVIQHGEQYTTKYLHLSAFANGVRAGKSVRQGDVIGYVGATGWATAPHLHYEFLVNGVHRNPRTVKLPQANPVPEAELARFRQTVLPVLARLESITGNTGYAMAEPGADTGG
ncbi:MAG: peptidoglycan DD-metalloendopeptidase family protein [Pseudomonadota bacterium]